MEVHSVPTEYMVRVQCMTYNHAPYIEDAMNGFCMQETDFPYVCVIVDDASTDGEPEVIKYYLEKNFDLQGSQCFREEDTGDYHLIFAKHKINPNCYFGVLLLKYNHWKKKKAKTPYYEEWTRSKYIALCEGDDNWTHPKKLQMQVDALFKHQECSFCSCGFKIVKRGAADVDMTIPCNNLEVVYGIDAWFKLWVTKTLTLLIREDVYKKNLALLSRYTNPKDIHLQYHLFKSGKCLYLSSCMGTYNNNGQGIWNSKSEAQKLEWDFFTLRELYYKNEKETIIKDRYIPLLIRFIRCREIKCNKLKFFFEGMFYIRDNKERKLILIGYYNCIKDCIWRITIRIQKKIKTWNIK